MSFASAAWEALGTSAEVVVTHPEALPAARDAVEEELEAIDLACSRFRADADLARVNAADGKEVSIGPLLAEAVAVALEAARDTDGLVDPTVGAAMIAAGYDRHFAELPADAPKRPAFPAPGWHSVELDRARGTLKLAPGARLDLGATAKALAADRAVRAAAARVAPHGVLVNLGGDLAVAGEAPTGAWPVGIADGHRDAEVSTTVAISSGGLATSSTTQRRWRRGGVEVHHILDPRTGAPVPIFWRTVSVAAPSCVEANTATTASIVLGPGAPGWLTGKGLPARLVAADGRVVTTCGWAVGGEAA